MRAVGNWLVEETLGAGASSVVYACHNRFAPTMRAAVKVLVAADDPQAAAREAQALAALSHPHIVRVRDVGWVDEQPYMVMDLLEGHPLAPGDPLSVLLDIADALAHAHEHGIQHGDVKAEHVRVVDGRGVLLDFGLTGTVRGGTPHYAPPEWFTGGALDRTQQDVYGLGVVLHEHLTQTPAGATAARLPRRRALDPGPGVAAGLRGLVLRMTSIKPSARPSAAEVRDRLAQLQPEVLPAPPRPDRPSRRRTGVALAVLVALAAVLGIASGSRRPPLEPAEPTPAPPAIQAPSSPIPAAVPPAHVAVPPAEGRAKPEQDPQPPAPAPIAAPVSEALPRVEVVGDALRVWLVDGETRHDPGAVPAGSYEILALFTGVEPVVAGHVEVTGATTVRCAASLLRCVAQ